MPGTGEKQRPVPRRYIQALENHIAHLESFINKLAAASPEVRDKLLAEFGGQEPSKSSAAAPGSGTDDVPASQDQTGCITARARSGQMRTVADRNASQFFGGTSIFELHLSKDASVPISSYSPPRMDAPNPSLPPQLQLEFADELFFSPHHDQMHHLLAVFFKRKYAYSMFIYREYFLRDYDAGGGKYFSDALLYAMSAIAAPLSDDVRLQAMSSQFAAYAESLVYAALNLPDITTLQSLLLLSRYAISQGYPSKGWLFGGMAFRLVQEMGLHLDPQNWKVRVQSSVDTEILRRVYWASFMEDKHMSLYFGRPPALHPYESDVRNTIRIPYPPEWESLLDTYIAKDTSATAYEDGIALVASFIHQVELSKIFHTLLVDVFENRQRAPDNILASSTLQQIHIAMMKWLATLPGKLHWNQWMVGQAPAYVLHLHMLFHTGMIILHRPPRHFFNQPNLSAEEDIEICYQSLNAIIRLLKSYSRYYSYRDLPIDFVHTLATAAGTVLMKCYLDKLPWKSPEIERPFQLILGAMDAVKDIWPCVNEIRESLAHAMRTEHVETPTDDAEIGLGFLTGANLNLLEMPQFHDADHSALDADLGILMTDQFMQDQFSWEP